MLFKEFGNPNAPVFVALHGGGLSWWSLENIIDPLQTEYRVVVPVIDGHGEDAKTTFVSIQDSAQKLISYIDHNCGGQIFALSGLSLGAQIVTEVLSIRPDITQYAIIESALVLPLKGVRMMAKPAYDMCYGLIRQRWFARLQAKANCLPEDMFERYFQDSASMSKQSLIQITLSNGTYRLQDSIAKTSANVLIIVGEKELKVMKQSARKLHETISGSKLLLAEGLQHGELDLRNPETFLEHFRNLIADSQSRAAQ